MIFSTISEKKITDKQSSYTTNRYIAHKQVLEVQPNSSRPQNFTSLSSSKQHLDTVIIHPTTHLPNLRSRAKRTWTRAHHAHNLTRYQRQQIYLAGQHTTHGIRFKILHFKKQNCLPSSSQMQNEKSKVLVLWLSPFD